MRVFLFIMLFAITFSLGCNKQVYTSWYAPGPIQVLASSNEVWFFIEIDRLVQRPGGAWDAPRTIPVGHFQEVVAVNTMGDATRVRVAQEGNVDGVTFNHNISSLFRHKGALFTLVSGSRDTQRTVFKWNGNRFAKLSEDDNDRFIKENLLSGIPSEVDKRLNELSLADGWHRIHADLGVGNDSYKWDGVTVTQRVRLDRGKCRIELVIGDNTNTPIVLEFQESFTQHSELEFKALSRGERGYLRKE